MAIRQSRYIVWVNEDTDASDGAVIDAIAAIPGFVDYDWEDYVD